VITNTFSLYYRIYRDAEKTLHTKSVDE